MQFQGVPCQFLNPYTFLPGINFPDALAGSVLAAKNNAPIILVGKEVIKQEAYIDNKKYSNLIFFGGEKAIRFEYFLLSI